MTHAFVHDSTRWGYDEAFVPTATSAAALVAAPADGGPFSAERYAVPPSALDDADVPRDATDWMAPRTDELLFGGAS